MPYPTRTLLQEIDHAREQLLRLEPERSETHPPFQQAIKTSDPAAPFDFESYDLSGQLRQLVNELHPDTIRNPLELRAWIDLTTAILFDAADQLDEAELSWLRTEGYIARHRISKNPQSDPPQSDPYRRLGLYVLKRMTDYESWNADMLDEIADFAFARGIAHAPNGLFEMIPDPEETGA